MNLFERLNRSSSETPIGHGTFGLPFSQVRHLLEQIAAGEEISVFNPSAMKTLSNSAARIDFLSLPNAIGTKDNFRQIEMGDHNTGSLKQCLPPGSTEAREVIDYLEEKGLYNLTKDDFRDAREILRFAAAMRPDATDPKLTLLATFLSTPPYSQNEDSRDSLVAALIILDTAGLRVTPPQG